MRLINADTLKGVFENTAWDYAESGNCEMTKLYTKLAKIVDEQPTAYDLDEVINKLQGNKFKESLEIVLSGL